VSKEALEYIARNMREIDRTEVIEMSGSTDVHGRLMEAWKLPGDMFAAYVNGNPACVFGAHSVSVDRACVWLLATDEFVQHPMSIFRLGKKWLALLQTKYPSLENFVRADNTHAIQWLRWLGFTVAAEPVTITGAPYYHFRKTHV
jgi:hypothetical protein